MKKLDAHGKAIAFLGSRCCAYGTVMEVARRVREILDGQPADPVLIFDPETGEVMELDLRGSVDEVLSRLDNAPVSTPDASGSPERRGRGRPRLGVVAREVTLLPRHWAWLNAQPGGASVTLRRMVEAARREGAGRDRVRRSREAAYRFITVMAGDMPGYEEAVRALFAGRVGRFEELVDAWPGDIGRQARHLARDAWVPAG